MTVNLRIEFIPWKEVSEHVFGVWREFAETINGSPDLQPEWVKALIEAHQLPIEQLSLLLAFDGNQLRLLSPLRASREKIFRLNCLTIEPVQGIFALHQKLLTNLGDDEALEVLFAAIRGQYRRWTIVRLRGLVAKTGLAQAFQNLPLAQRIRFREESGRRQPYLEISQTWEAYLRGKSANFRSNLKRKARKLSSAGSVSIEFFVRLHEARSALSTIRDIEMKSWKLESGTALVVRHWEARFYEMLIEGLADQGKILISLLRLNGAAIAYDLTVTGARRAYCLKTSFDSHFKELSPGLVLRERLMERVFTDQYIEYDFLGKDERYKLEWATGIRQEISIVAFNPETIFGKLLYWLFKVRALFRLNAFRPATFGAKNESAVDTQGSG